jgi:hypothetical protein
MDVSDAYRPPKADISGEPSGPGAGAKLYSPGQVAGATFLGSPIAGALLIASNFRVLGAPRSQRNAIIAGVAATLACMGLSFILPKHFPGVVIPIAYTIALRAIANGAQGDAYREHIASGGLKRSNGTVVGIGLACLVAIVALTLTAFMLFDRSSDS